MHIHRTCGDDLLLTYVKLRPFLWIASANFIHLQQS
jgi:hypothetical protein